MLRDKLLNTALNLFSQYGIKQMTMEDVSRSCGVSKKTLYSQFENKAALVDAVTVQVVERIRQDYEDNRVSSRNAIAETINLLHHFEIACKKINFRILQDLNKYYYDSWIKIDAFKQGVWRQIIECNLQRGRQEGLYHNEFDNGIITHMRLQQLAFMHRTAMQNLTLHETLYQITLHYLKGIATPEGLDLIKKLQSNTI